MVFTEAMRHALRLQGMTLRGIGPYSDTARLDLLPITLLCGKNGSGKSTWFRALDLIRRSVAMDEFPFVWDAPLHWASDIHSTNAKLYLQGVEGDGKQSFDEIPPGSVELEFLAVDDFHCSPPFGFAAAEHALQFALWAGQIVRGTRIAIRFSHPEIASDEPTTLHYSLSSS